MNIRALVSAAVLYSSVCMVPLDATAAEILHYDGSIFDDSVDPMDGLPGMSAVTSIAVSPDGLHLYAVSNDDSRLTLFDRDPSTGALTFHQAIANSIAIGNGLTNPHGVVVSADGKHVYVTPAGGAFTGVTAFSRNLVTGELTFIEVERHATLVGEARMALSPNGQQLYVAARASDAVLAYARDGTTGALTYLQSFVDGSGGVNGLDQAIDLRISPDGNHLYVVAFGDSALTIFDRDSGTGLLTFQSEHFDNTLGYDFLQGAASLAVSPEGTEVYLNAFYEQMSIYDRDPTTGELTFRSHPVTGGAGGYQYLVMSEDGGRLYVGVWVSALDTFARNPANGDLTFLERKVDGTGGVDGIDGSQGVMVSPDGQDVYTGSFYDKALSHFAVACGNGVTDAGEECDDLNPFGADCCSSTCTLPTGCLLPAKAQLQIQHGADPTKDKLKWKWLKGAAFTQAEVGTPAADTEYRLCVYDRTADVTRLAVTVGVAPGATWIDQDPKGAKYVDKFGTGDGVQQMQIKTGELSRTKAQVKAGGLNLSPLLSPYDGSTFFDQDTSVSVLLVNGAGTCWSSEFAPAGTSRNEAGAFKSKTP